MILFAVAALMTAVPAAPAAIAAPGTFGQEGSTPPPPLPEPPHLQMGGGEHQARDEMIKLFQEVEARLKEGEFALLGHLREQGSLCGASGLE